MQCFSRDGEDFQLLGGTVDYYSDDGFRAVGRVDVCFNRTFGSVCSRGWSDDDANAFCRYSYGRGTMGVAINGSRFGISPIGIVLSDVKCTGHPGESILDCTYGGFGSFVGSSAQCSGLGDVAGAMCMRECDDGNVRLVSGSAYYEGRVEACFNNRWGSICEIGWDNVDASVTCRSLQFYGGES